MSRDSGSCFLSILPSLALTGPGLASSLRYPGGRGFSVCVCVCVCCGMQEGVTRLFLQGTLTIMAIFLQMPLNLVRGEACSFAHPKIGQTFFCGLGVRSLHGAPFRGARGQCVPSGGVLTRRGPSSEYPPACLSGFLPLSFLPPPGYSSRHVALTPVPLAAAGHPPSPQLVLMREEGGARLPPPSDQGLAGWDSSRRGQKREIFLLTRGNSGAAA